MALLRQRSIEYTAARDRQLRTKNTLRCVHKIRSDRVPYVESAYRSQQELKKASGKVLDDAIIAEAEAARKLCQLSGLWWELVSGSGRLKAALYDAKVPESEKIRIKLRGSAVIEERLKAELAAFLASDGGHIEFESVAASVSHENH